MALNVTVANATAGGDFRLGAAGLPAPLASTLNFSSGAVRANNAVVALGAYGRVGVRCDMAAGSADAVLDVVGYFQ